jgi:hypothetical protein
MLWWVVLYHKAKNNSQHSDQIYFGNLKEKQLFKLVLLYSDAVSCFKLYFQPKGAACLRFVFFSVLT